MTSTVIAMPFSFNSFGKVNTTTDSRKAWQDRVLLVLMTKFGERLVRPNYGTDLSTTLFENSSIASEVARKTITIAFNQWLDSLNLIDVIPLYNNNTGYLEVTVTYRLPSGETDVVTLNTAIFNRYGDLILEITNG